MSSSEGHPVMAPAVMDAALLNELFRLFKNEIVAPPTEVGALTKIKDFLVSATAKNVAENWTPAKSLTLAYWLREARKPAPTNTRGRLGLKSVERTMSSP